MRRRKHCKQNHNVIFLDEVLQQKQEEEEEYATIKSHNRKKINKKKKKSTTNSSRFHHYLLLLYLVLLFTITTILKTSSMASAAMLTVSTISKRSIHRAAATSTTTTIASRYLLSIRTGTTTSRTTTTQLSYSSSSSSELSSLIEQQQQQQQQELIVLQNQITKLNNGQNINLNSPKQISKAIFGNNIPIQSVTKSILKDIATSTTTSSTTPTTIVSPTKQQQQLAGLILQYRELLSKMKKQQQQQQQHENNNNSNNTKLTNNNNNTFSTVSTKTSTSSSTPTTTTSKRLQSTVVTSSSTSLSSSSLSTTATATESPNIEQQQQQGIGIGTGSGNGYNELVESLFDFNTNSKIDIYWKEPLLKLSKSTSRILLSQLDSTICPMGYNPLATPNNKASTTTTTTSTMAGRKGSFLSYYRQQKELYPQCIILIRCGDFYETYGIDAILLVEYVGLNSMAGKCKAGCPIRNIQLTLDPLTNAGFTIAVYEEITTSTTQSSLSLSTTTTTNTNKKSTSSSKNSQLKTRILSQIVSPASPTYLYDDWLLNKNQNHVDALDNLPYSRPCVGIISTSSNVGYTIIEVSLEERKVVISERLTAEAIACRLAAYPPADPLLYVPSQSEYTNTNNPSSTSTSTTTYLPFLPTKQTIRRNTATTSSSKITKTTKNPSSLFVESTWGGYRIRTKLIPPIAIQEPTPTMTDVDRYTKTIIEAVLQMNEYQSSSQKEDEDNNNENNNSSFVGGGGRQQQQYHHRRTTTVDDFQIVHASSSSTTTGSSSSNTITTTQTSPLYMETATQLGLLYDKSIPSLVSYLVDTTAPIATKRFLQRYLLIPPPPIVADAMAQVVRRLMGGQEQEQEKDNNKNNTSSINNPSPPAALPPLAVPPLGKVLALLRAGQASAHLYGDLLQALYASQIVLQDSQFREGQQQQMNTNNTNNNTNDANETMMKQRKRFSSTIDALMILLEHESGLPSSHYNSLIERCKEATIAIEEVISPIFHVTNNNNYNNNDSSSSSRWCEDLITDDQYIPITFFERNEAHWRGRIRPEAAIYAYTNVQQASKKLCDSIRKDFIEGPKKSLSSSSSTTTTDIDDTTITRGSTSRSTKTTTTTKSKTTNPIVHDVFNNLIALKEKPKWFTQTHVNNNNNNDEYYFHPRDRHGKILGNRYTTKDVQDALSNYIVACDEACDEVATVLSDLSQRLYDNGHIPSIVQSAHLNLILSTAFHHASKANTLGWNMAETFELQQQNQEITNDIPQIINLWPYWMDQSQAVSNTFDLDGLFLLTAPNMSGKSTIMRSTAAAALLTICGLCAPLHAGSYIPRIDTLFVRGASADVPIEHKSAFGAEMEDISALLRCCGYKSWIFVDELGRGTSPHDGTRLAGAVLEAMATSGMSGIFATHLHDLLNLPLQGSYRIKNKRMAITQKGRRRRQQQQQQQQNQDQQHEVSTLQEKHERYDDDNNIFTNDGTTTYDWTYRLEDGVCTDSLALVTAARFGLPDAIIRRAEELGNYLTPVNNNRRNRKSLNDDGQSITTMMEGMRTNNNNDDAGQSNIGQDDEIDNNMMTENCFLRAIELAEDMTGQSPVTIPPQWSPPATLASGTSCLYVLEIAHNPPRYYVGETDSLSQRLQQHRRKGGRPWSHLKAAAFPVQSKTEARHMESLLIQQLAKVGIRLESIEDGRSIRPKNRK